MPNIKYKKQFPLTGLSRIRNLNLRGIGFCGFAPAPYWQDIPE